METSLLMGVDKTQGHFNPAVVCAQFLRRSKPSLRIYFYPIKREWIKVLERVGCFGIGKLLDQGSGFGEAVMRAFEACPVIRQIRPCGAIGYGGRRSFFALLLLSFRRPIALYEPNAVLGKANLVLSLFAKKIFMGFPIEAIPDGCIRRLVHGKMVHCGIPLRPDFFSLSAKEKSTVRRDLGLDPLKKTLLVFGGSTGASFINAAVYDFIKRENEVLDRVQVVHITGKNDYRRYQRDYQGISGVVVKEYADDIWQWYWAADAVVCRAGASSLAEVNYFRIPAVLMPLPGGYAHQYHNAAYLVKRGCAYSIDQNHFDYSEFKDRIYAVLFDDQARARLRGNLEQVELWSPPEPYAQCIERAYIKEYLSSYLQ